MIYNSSESNDKLLIRSNEVPIHQKRLGALATEIYEFRRYKCRFYDTIFYNKRNASQFTKWIYLKTIINKFHVLRN